MKPHIRYITPYLYGIPCRKQWACQSPEAIELGDSPQQAYEKWERSAPKTAFGRWVARVCDKILYFLGFKGYGMNTQAEHANYMKCGQNECATMASSIEKHLQREFTLTDVPETTAPATPPNNCR